MISQDHRQSGSLTAAEAEVVINSPGTGTVVAQLSGTFSATVTFEATLETGASPTWVAVPATNVATGTVATTATAAGLFRINAASLHRIRARCSAYTSGTVNVVLQASAGSSGALAGGASGAGVVDTELPAAAAGADTVAAAGVVLPGVFSYMEVYDATNNQYNRVRSANSVPDAAGGGTMPASVPFVFNGTTWDRQRSANSDAQAATGIAASGNMTWNGSTWDRHKGTAADGAYIQGSTASGASSTANPIIIAGIGAGGTNVRPLVSRATNIDGQTAGDIVPVVLTEGYLFNGSTYDRQRNNLDSTIYTSAARTATPTAVQITNYNGRAIHVVLDVTAIAATPSITLTISGVDAVSGKVYTILAGAAVTGVSTTTYKVGPALTPAANLVANDYLPRGLQISVTHGDADSITYSVGASIVTA